MADNPFVSVTTKLKTAYSRLSSIFSLYNPPLWSLRTPQSSNCRASKTQVVGRLRLQLQSYEGANRRTPRTRSLRETKMGALSEFNDAAVDAARLLKRLELALGLRLKALIARARRASRKIASRETSISDHSLSLEPGESPMASPMRNSKFALPSPTARLSPKSPLRRLKLSTDSPLLASPKRLLATLSNKAAPLLQRWKVEEEEKGGLWQKEILMGEKCQPLDFSGVIYYDKHGKLVSGIPPRSPRHGGRQMVQSFSFPVPLSEKEDC